ncbi:MAG: ferrous iron transport protein A [Oscillospiraceae bacterium]
MRTINNLKPGQKGKVINILTQGALKRRLIDMGITPGVIVMVRKVAPLGDPIEINLRGYELTIRKAEAEKIIIEDER